MPAPAEDESVVQLLKTLGQFVHSGESIPVDLLNQIRIVTIPFQSLDWMHDHERPDASSRLSPEQLLTLDILQKLKTPLVLKLVPVLMPLLPPAVARVTACTQWHRWTARVGGDPVAKMVRELLVAHGNDCDTSRVSSEAVQSTCLFTFLIPRIQATLPDLVSSLEALAKGENSAMTLFGGKLSPGECLACSRAVMASSRRLKDLYDDAFESLIDKAEEAWRLRLRMIDRR